MTLSVDISKSIIYTTPLLYLAARMAASLQRLAISAPLNPGVNDANLFAYYYFVYFGQSTKGDK